MDDVIAVLLDEIKAADRPENLVNYQQFFKERLEHPQGLRTSVLRGISNKVFRTVRPLGRAAILGVCDRMLAGGKRYMRFFAFDWAGKLAPQYDRSDFARFERWLSRYVDDWADCDHLCGAILGPQIARYPDLSRKRHRWLGSRNLWLRRAAAVSLIEPSRRGLLLDDVLETARRLLQDDEDLVQKGYGWMLKEAGESFPDGIRKFVMDRRHEMPRTALRYAIEKWPQAMRKQALKKE